MNFGKAEARSLIIGGKIQLDEQCYQLCSDGSLRLTVTERQQQARRNALLQRINQLSQLNQR
ncbi:hypothetical protein [Photorhabdus sp. CRCIA-P01]|uniref:hypothetical protein n=1 Tax=Photorhabdus sp. CRCIA-P01 TaxID=2019570 RepID=UPI0013001C8B|nr:hypothetical protein [Photorhabdus sp. CRCIA-P01]